MAESIYRETGIQCCKRFDGHLSTDKISTPLSSGFHGYDRFDREQDVPDVQTLPLLTLTGPTGQPPWFSGIIPDLHPGGPGWQFFRLYG